jgi:hypothetical protein
LPHGRTVRQEATVNAPPPVPTAPVASRRAWPRRAAIGLVAVVVITLIRPWGVATAPPSASPRVSDAADLALLPTPTPGAAPSLLPDEIACPPAGWQLVSLDRLGTWTVRSWVPADIVAASGPLDPRVPRMTLESPEVLAIGACAPPIVASDGRLLPGGPARLLRAWRLDAGAATTVPLDVRRPVQTPSVATLYQPATAVSAGVGPSHWPGGTYVVELGAMDTDGGGTDDPSGTAGSPPGGWFVAFVVRGPT